MGGIPQDRSAEPHAHVYIRSPYGTFATTDGYLALAMPNLPLLGELIDEPSFADYDGEIDGWTRRDELYAKVAERLATRSTDEWLAILQPAGIWVAPVYSYADLVDDEQIRHNGTFVEYDHPTEGHVKTPGFPYKFSKTPARIDRGAPLTGEHTRDILVEAGFDEAAIDGFAANGVVVSEQPG